VKAVRVLLVLILFASPHAVAAITFKGPVTISGIYGLPDGGFLLLLPGGTDAACGSSGNQFHVEPSQVGQSIDGVKSALAIALSAFSLGKTINIYYDNTISGCPVQQIGINP